MSRWINPHDRTSPRISGSAFALLFLALGIPVLPWPVTALAIALGFLWFQRFEAALCFAVWYDLLFRPAVPAADWGWSMTAFALAMYLISVLLRSRIRWLHRV